MGHWAHSPKSPSEPRRSCTWAYVLHHMGHHGTSPCTGTGMQHTFISYILWALRSRSREGNRDHGVNGLSRLTQIVPSRAGLALRVPVPSLVCLHPWHLLTAWHLLNQVLIPWILLAGLGVVCEVSQRFLGNGSQGAYPVQTLNVLWYRMLRLN